MADRIEASTLQPQSGKAIKLAWFLSFFFLVFALGGSLAHLYALPHKLGLPAEDYLTVQRIYRGWALLGIPIVGTLSAMLALIILLLRQARAFSLVMIAFLCVLGTQVIFWITTFPVNQATSNWTVLPENWLALRARWEWSHASGAALNVAAFNALVLSLLSSTSPR